MVLDRGIFLTLQAGSNSTKAHVTHMHSFNQYLAFFSLRFKGYLPPFTSDGCFSAFISTFSIIVLIRPRSVNDINILIVKEQICLFKIIWKYKFK